MVAFGCCLTVNVANMALHLLINPHIRCVGFAAAAAKLSVSLQ